MIYVKTCEKQFKSIFSVEKKNLFDLRTETPKQEKRKQAICLFM